MTSKIIFLVPVFMISLICHGRLDETITQCSIRYGKSNYDREIDKATVDKDTDLTKATNEQSRKAITARYYSKLKDLEKRFTTPDSNGFIRREYEKNNLPIRCWFLSDKCVKIEYQDSSGMEDKIKELYPDLNQIKNSDIKPEYRKYLDKGVSIRPDGKSTVYELAMTFRGNDFYLFIFKGAVQAVSDKYYEAILKNVKPVAPEKKKSMDGL